MGSISKPTRVLASIHNPSKTVQFKFRKLMVKRKFRETLLKSPSAEGCRPATLQLRSALPLPTDHRPPTSNMSTLLQISIPSISTSPCFIMHSRKLMWGGFGLLLMLSLQRYKILLLGRHSRQWVWIVIDICKIKAFYSQLFTVSTTENVPKVYWKISLVNFILHWSQFDSMEKFWVSPEIFLWKLEYQSNHDERHRDTYAIFCSLSGSRI